MMLSVHLFGGLALFWQDKPLPVIPSKVARSILAYLLVHRDRVHTRDLLAGTFWPEMPEDVARRRLSQALWQIRDSLRDMVPQGQDVASPIPTLILTESDTLQINPNFPLWVDADIFEQHLEKAAAAGPAAIPYDEAALTLYEGEFMEGYYEDWAVAMREQIRFSLLDALARLVDGYKSLGDYEHALIYARRWVQEEPWHEPAHCAVMRLCHLLHRDADALKQFEDCRQFLADEIGAEPTQEMQVLAQEIARHGEISTGVDLPAMPAQAMPAIFDSDGAPALPLVGRESERATLLTHVEALMQGLGGLILVEGEAGVGKSRLLHTFADDAEWRGIEVLWGASREVARTTPYDLLVEALSANLTALRARQLAQLVAGIWLQALKPLIPTLAALFPDLPEAPHLDPAQEKGRLAVALSHLLDAWSQITPIVLILEDLQWAGADTLALLAQLIPMLKDHRTLIVGSYRSAEARSQPQVWQRIESLDRAGVQKRLLLQGLNTEACAELIRRSMGLAGTAPLFEARLYQETQGNPLFVLETLRALHSEGLLTRDKHGHWNTPWDKTTTDYTELPLPPAVEHTITRRLELLSPAQRGVVHLAAVMGEHIDFDVLCAAWKGESQSLLAAVRDLVRCRFLNETACDYGFSHSKVRQVAYADMDALLQLDLHRRVAGALETLHPDQIAALAYHWTRAEEWEQSMHYHRQAGDGARVLYANADAVAHYTQALEALERLPEDPAQRCALLLSREAVYDLTGDRAAQAEDLAALSALADGLDDAVPQATIYLRQANYDHADGDYVSALAAVRLGIRLAQSASDTRLQAEGYRYWGRILWHQGNFDEAYRRLEVSIKLAQEHDLREVAAQSFCDLGAIAGQQGEYERAIADFVKSLHICREFGDHQREGLILNNLGIVSRMQGDYDQARAYHEQSLHIRRETGDLRGESSVLNSLGIICRHQGDYVPARVYFEQALQIMRLIGDRWFECRTLYNLGMCMRDLGVSEDAHEFFERSLYISLEIGDKSSEASALEGLGYIAYHYQGNHLLALEKFLEAQQLIAGAFGADESYILTNLGTVLLDLGRLKEAQESYQRAVDLRRDIGQSNQVLGPQAGLARVCLQQGDLSTARQHVDEILTHLEASPPLGVDEPFRVYLTCYRVLLACEDPRASACLAEAHAMLQERAARIDDAALRHSFLENVAANRELVITFRAAQDAAPTKRQSVSLPGVDVPPGRPLGEADYVSVVWTLDAPEDASIVQKVPRRRRRLLRLLREAQAQSAIPRDEDLARALEVSLATLRRDIAALRAAGYKLPPRRRGGKD